MAAAIVVVETMVPAIGDGGCDVRWQQQLQEQQKVTAMEAASAMVAAKVMAAVIRDNSSSSGRKSNGVFLDGDSSNGDGQQQPVTVTSNRQRQ